MKYLKRSLAILLSLALFSAGFPVAPARTDTATAKSSVKNEKDKTVVPNEAILSLAVPKFSYSPLLEKGVYKNDPAIRIRRVMDFGSADVLGKNPSDKKSLSGDTFYAVHVTSDRYTTAQLKEKLSVCDYVQSVTENRRVKEIKDRTIETSRPADGLKQNTFSQLNKEASTNDPLIGEQWALDGSAFGTDSPNYIPEAKIGYQPETVSGGSAAPIVAIIDQGVDYTHEDLKNKMWKNPYKSLKGKYGYDCVNDDPDPMPDPGDDHGTLCAVIIAAETGNGVGIAGVSKEAQIMSLRFFDSTNENSGTVATELVCLEYIYQAMKRGANVVAINCSYGDAEPSETKSKDNQEEISLLGAVHERLGVMGALHVHAAGNESTDLDKKPYGSPWELDTTYGLLVGAIARNGKMADFSNYSPKLVHLMAPGIVILSTTNYNCFSPAFYDAEKRQKLCRFVDEFPTGHTGFISYDELKHKNTGVISLAHSGLDFRSLSDSGSCELTLNRVRNADPDAYKIYYDVTDYHIDTDKMVYLALDISGTYVGEEDWVHIEGGLSELYSETDPTMLFGYESFGGRTYMTIDVKALVENPSINLGKTICIDNFSLSVDDPDPDEFGEYIIVSGTSFSTPMVCGAIARLATKYPKDNALTRRKKLLDSVTKLDSLKDKCITGGTLNVATTAETDSIHVDPIVYKVKSITLNKTSATLKAGKTLKLKATVDPDYATNTKVSWMVNHKNYASVDSHGVVKAKKAGRGHTVKVTATARDGSKKKAVCKIRIQ